MLNKITIGIVLVLTILFICHDISYKRGYQTGYKEGQKDYANGDVKYIKVITTTESWETKDDAFRIMGRGRK